MKRYLLISMLLYCITPIFAQYLRTDGTNVMTGGLRIRREGSSSIELESTSAAFIDFKHSHSADYNGRIIWNYGNSNRFDIYGKVNFKHDVFAQSIQLTNDLTVAGIINGKTQLLDDPNSTEDWNTIWQSGFFQAHQKANAPEGDNWFWGINLGHSSNNSNYRYGGQILIKNATNTPIMYFRSRDKNGDGIWAKVLHNKGNQRIEGNLTVNGVFNSEEVKVETIAANNITYTTNGNTADFVFEDNYHLKDLSEVEAFIKTNKHLPEIPSADEMEETSVNLAEMNKLLLMKVEELTLYSIEQEKRLEIKDKEMDDLKKRLEKVEKFINQL